MTYITKAEHRRIADLTAKLCNIGFQSWEVDDLRRISATLSRWAEAECNGEIERDETTNKPYRVSQGCAPSWRVTRWPVRDMESGALNRLRKILAYHPQFTYYHQGDPRGVALYLIPVDRLNPGDNLDCVYSSIGIPVY